MVSQVYPPPVSTRSASAMGERAGVRPSMQSADRPPPIEAVPIVTSTVAELECSVPIDEPHGSIGPRTGISPLARRSAPVPVYDPPVEPTKRSGPDVERLERPDVSHRFEYRSADDELRPGPSSTGRRLVQGAVVLALIAAAGALLWVLPESEDSLFATGKPTGRVEATGKPAATSELPSGADRPEVEGSLRLLAASGRLSRSGLDRAPGVAAGDEQREGLAAAAAAVDEVAVAVSEQPATTARPEPTIAPESEWVDSGNGVVVPDLLLRIRFCESTNNYSATNPRSTASGAYQFLDKSWDWYGHAARTGVSRAHLATRAQQDQAALSTLQAQGTAPWAASRSCWTDENINPRYATASRPPARSTTTAPTTTDTTGTSETTAGGSSTTAATATSTTGGTGSTVTPSSETTNPSTTTSSQPASTTAPPTTAASSTQTTG